MTRPWAAVWLGSSSEEKRRPGYDEFQARAADLLEPAGRSG
jgi:hypothetical protein